MEAWAGFRGVPGPAMGFKLENNVATFESGSPPLPSANSLESLEARAGAVGLGRVDRLGSYRGGGVPTWSWFGCGR